MQRGRRFDFDVTAIPIRRGVAWAFVGRVSDQLLTFAFGVVLARLLAPEAFGMLLTIQIFTGLVGFVAGGGMGQALVRAQSVTKEDFDVVFTLQLLIGCVIYGLFFVTAPLFADWYGNPMYRDLLRLSALSFVFRPFVTVPTNALHRDLRFKAMAGVNIACLIASSGVSIALALRGWDVWSLIWGGIAGSAVRSVLLMWQTGWRPAFSLRFARAGGLARYGALVAGNDLVDYLRERVSIFILSQTLGPQSVALFNKGESLAMMPFQFVSGSVYQVLFRALAVEQANLDKCRYLFTRSVGLVAIYATPFYVALFWLAEPLVRGVYGERWVGSAGPLFWLSFAWPMWLLGNLSGAVAASHNRLNVELRLQLLTLALNAVAIWLALPAGINGVAWALLAVFAISSSMMLALALRTLQAAWRDALRALYPAIALNLALAFVLASVERVLPTSILSHDLLHVVSLAGVGAAVYALLVLYTPLPALRSEQTRWRSALRLPV